MEYRQTLCRYSLIEEKFLFLYYRNTIKRANLLFKFIAVQLSSLASSTTVIKPDKLFVGYLGRRVDDLSKAVTDMLVRQKQVGRN